MKTVKCFFCKKEIKKENAYMWIYTSKTGKEYKKYCCSFEEKESIERDKELYKKIQFITDEILGYPCINNIRNKKITELVDAGFSNEQIYRCFQQYKDEIIKWIEFNKIDKEFNKISYMFGVIKNTIYDFSREDAKKDWVQKETNEEIENYEEKEESENDIVKRLRENKKENENSISSFLNGLK